MKIAVAAMVAILAWGWYASDRKINHLQKEQNIAHCQITLYEDYSSEFADAEVVKACVHARGYELKWNK